MKKIAFEEPEMEVGRFTAKDLIITASGPDDTPTAETGGTPDCEGDNCTGAADDDV